MYQNGVYSPLQVVEPRIDKKFDTLTKSDEEAFKKMHDKSKITLRGPVKDWQAFAWGKTFFHKRNGKPLQSKADESESSYCPRKSD